MSSEREIVEALGLEPHPAGGFSLVGCTVSPRFEFSGFELAPEGWEPGGGWSEG